MTVSGRRTGSVTEMKVEKNDILFAHLALHLVPGLAAGARRCGAAIIEHFNKRTGQCDPSIERLARMLGMDRATVMRGISELCDGADALFERATHGGRLHRTAYLPRWDRLNDVVADWNARMKDGSPPAKGAKTRPSQSQKCDVDSRKNATQTVRRNRPNQPQRANTEADQARSEVERGSEGKISAPHKLAQPETTFFGKTGGRLVELDARYGLGRENRQRGSSHFLDKRGAERRSPNRADVAREQAKKRLSDATMQTDLGLWMAEHDPDNASFGCAVEAEVMKRGSGLSVLQEARRLHGRHRL
jgi:hypothetical protein